MSRHFEGLHLSSIELFCLVAEHQGFANAAHVAGLSPAAVSRSIARLEARLGAKLFQRTTRKVRLTEAGQRYFDECRQALNQLTQAEREITGLQQRPTGHVSLSLPTSYGHYRVLPLMHTFRERYPDITLALQLSNRNVDLVTDHFDLAIRARKLPESNLVAIQLEEAPLVIVAAPHYLERKGVPHCIADLTGHECIQFTLPSTGQVVPWMLKQDGEIAPVETRGALHCSEDILAPVTLARTGAGIAQTYRFLVEEDLRDGHLVELLAQHRGASRPFSLMYPADRHMPSRVRAVIDFLKDELRR